jgi:hypothetical protein
MASIVIDKFGGIDRKSNDTDLSPSIGRQVKNFSTTKRPGALGKSGSYADAASTVFGSTLPASITWQNIAEIPLTLPENRDIYILHGKSGSNHHLWVGKYWNGSAFVSGFVKITENEGSYTCDAGTSGSQIVDTQLSSSVDDYYNGWVVTLNNSAASLVISAIVQDYNGTTKTLSFKTDALGSGGLAAASGDTYYISRTPVLANTVGAGVGIANVDDIIRFLPRENAVICMTGNANQFPTQYQLWYGYINREYGVSSPTETFNNFYLDAQQLQKPALSSSLSNQRGIMQLTPQSGGSLAAGTWTIYAAYEFDGFQIGPISDGYAVTLADNNNSIRIYTELPLNGSFFDTTTETGLTADAGTNSSTIVDAGLSSAVDDFYNNWICVYANNALTQVRYAIVTDYVGATKTLSFDTDVLGIGATVGDTYSLRKNPLTADSFIKCFDSNSIGLKATAYNLSKRITGIYYFSAAPSELGGNNAKLINTGGFASNNPLTVCSSDDADNSFALDSNSNYLLMNGSPRSLMFSTTPTGSTYIELAGQTGVNPNFKYAVALDTHVVAAGIRTEEGERKNNHIISSIVDGSGVAAPDVFGGSNIINLGFYGSKEITGIKVIGDTSTTTSPKRRLLVATDDDVYVMTLTTGQDFDFALDRIGDKEGIIAPDSIVSAEGMIFGVSRNGFRVFTESGTEMIGEGLKDDFDALTDPTEGVGAYFKKHRLVVWSFATDSKVFALDLLSKDFQMIELSLAHAMTILLGARTGELYSMSTAAFYQHESGSTQAGTAITPVWRSKKLTAKDFFDETTGFNGSADADFIPNEGFIRYKSDTAVTLNVYRNGGSAVTFNNLSLAAQSTAASKRFKFPLGLHCKDIEFEFTLSSAQAASNTSLEFDLIKVVGDIKKRMD